MESEGALACQSGFADRARSVSKEPGVNGRGYRSDFVPGIPLVGASLDLCSRHFPIAEQVTYEIAVDLHPQVGRILRFKHKSDLLCQRV